jgi:hypothetical protein
MGETIADNLSKAGEKQIASQTPEPWASGVQRGGSRHRRFEYRLQVGRISWMELGLPVTVDFEGRIIWIVDAHRDGKRFVVHADEKLDGVRGIGVSDLHRVAVGLLVITRLRARLLRNILWNIVVLQSLGLLL